MPAAELTVPAGAAGERLDVFLAGHAGSRAAAQRLIDGGHVTVDGEPRVKRHTLAGGERILVEEPVATPEVEVAPATFAAIGGARSCRRWRGASPAARTPSARASSTGSIATHRVCWSWRGRTPCTPP